MFPRFGTPRLSPIKCLQLELRQTTSSLKNSLVLLDDTEMFVQQPKSKNRRGSIAVRRNSTPSVVIEGTTGHILATTFASGATDDFALFKTSRLWFNNSTSVLADMVCQGLKKWRPNSQTYRKKPRRSS